MSADNDAGDFAFNSSDVERVRDEVLFGTGYQRPPKDTQFKKGQSGNPTGRPKKDKAAPPPVTITSYDEDVLAEMAKRDTVIDHGKKISVPRRQLLLGAQSAAAAKGNPLAQRNALAMSAEVERRAAAKAASDKAIAEKTFELMVTLKAIQQKTWDQFLITGKLVGDPYPRPEDILLDNHKQTYRIRGPYCIDDLPRCLALMFHRDHALITWVRMSHSDLQPDKWIALQWLMFDALNKELPLAWQLDDHDTLMHYCRYRSMSAKQLDLERDVLSEMEARLQLPACRNPDTGSRKVDLKLERSARHSGYASFSAMSDALEKARLKRLTPAIRQAAHERLEAMFTLNVDAERRRAAHNADLEAKRPLYEQRRVVAG